MNDVELKKLDDEMFGAYMEGNVDLILSHCSSDVLIQDFGAPPVQGKDAVREYLTQQFGTFSDAKGTRTKRIVGDNEVFSELEWTATNSGELQMPDGTSLPATGKTVTSRIAYYARVNDAGEVVEMRAYPDIMGMMGQLGLMGG